MGLPLYIENIGTLRWRNDVDFNKGTYSWGKEKNCQTREDGEYSRVAMTM